MTAVNTIHVVNGPLSIVTIQTVWEHASMLVCMLGDSLGFNLRKVGKRCWENFIR